MGRNFIREQSNAGLAAARARGHKNGRKPKLSAQQICHARKLPADPETTVKDVAASLAVLMVRAPAFRLHYRYLSRALVYAAIVSPAP